MTPFELQQIKQYFQSLQANIIKGIGQFEKKPFMSDSWERIGGGGGCSCVVEDGNLLERGGVNFSHVMGDQLPSSATTNRHGLSDASFEAMGVSLVFHPHNPYVPTVHMNVRLFSATSIQGESIWWFGGGMDLTPYYGFEEDVKHFHQICKNALDPFGTQYYPKFKNWCDEYFYLKHRNEPRGVGGVFFDDFAELGLEQSFELTRHIGNAFLKGYLPIIERRMNLAYGEREKNFQAYRRGRYVEFNLVFDRGTLFGLQSGGRTESILMSMPPQVKWRYDWKPDPDSAEARLYSDFLIHRNWIS
jgi:coproporphyrinogen III oxidase